MSIAVDNRCVLLNDAWDRVQIYIVIDVQSDFVLLRSSNDHLQTGPTRQIEKLEMNQLFVTPLWTEGYKNDPKNYAIATLVDDLAGTLLRHKGRTKVDDLISELQNEPRLAGIGNTFLQGCLRSLVAYEELVPFSDARRKSPTVHLELSTKRQKQENKRVFAGSFADELKALSQRIRSLVSHTGSVGTYRECLLQTLLRKNLPERYHVATGFIYGCSRQIDILIYDRIDYAPLFREGDLVVIPCESVRAVIEVKTDLTAAAIRDSLRLLDQVADSDDLNPPFFKGIFGFESSITPQQIYSSVKAFYVEDISDDTHETKEMEDWLTPITEPFRHVSSVCVLEHAYAQVNFHLKKGRLVPTLMHASSVSGLKAQAAYFLQHLLAYLRYDGLKDAGSSVVGKMLGADTRWTEHDSLAGENSWSWGAYFEHDEMGKGQEVVEEMEKRINVVMEWLKGARWS
jgi:hypothetical protein